MLTVFFRTRDHYSTFFFVELSVKFSSDDVVMSAPLKQKFICRDKLNITLSNLNYKDYILELQPTIDAQPYNIHAESASCKLKSSYSSEPKTFR